MPTAKTPEEIKPLLEGPVNSIPTPFLLSGEIDREGVANIIETGISGGSQVSLLTYGTGPTPKPCNSPNTAAPPVPIC